MRTPDYEESDDEPTSNECKRCGKGGLHWENDDGTWQLYENRYKLHKCDNARLPSDFEALP